MLEKPAPVATARTRNSIQAAQNISHRPHQRQHPLYMQEEVYLILKLSSLPRPRSTRYRRFSLGDPACPSRKFSGFTSPCTKLQSVDKHGRLGDHQELCHHSCVLSCPRRNRRSIPDACASTLSVQLLQPDDCCKLLVSTARCCCCAVPCAALTPCCVDLSVLTVLLLLCTLPSPGSLSAPECSRHPTNLGPACP